jgi:RNA polymerase sigma factor (sigma-70 family)
MTYTSIKPREQEKLVKVAIESGDLDKALILCEPLIKMQLYHMNYYNNFQSYYDDFLQDAKLNILKALTKFSNNSSVITYIYSVIKYSIYNTISSYGLYKHLKNDVELNPDLHTGEFSEHALNIYDSVVEDLYNYYIPAQRPILIDYFINGLASKECAAKHNISYTAVNVYVSTFRARMKRKYYGGGANEYEANANTRANAKRKEKNNAKKINQ